MYLRWVCQLMLLVSLPLTQLSGAPEEPVSLQGTWVPTVAELAGTKLPEPVLATLKLVVKDNTYIVTTGKQEDRGSLKVNTTAQPKEMDIAGTEGPNKGKTILCIYEQDGDKLRICYDLSGTRRPTEFRAAADTQHLLITYHRAKP